MGCTAAFRRQAALERDIHSGGNSDERVIVHRHDQRADQHEAPWCCPVETLTAALQGP